MRQVKKRKNKNQQIQLDQIDIREVLDEQGIDYRSSGKNIGTDWIGVDCVFCGDQGKHLGINLKSPVISCFKCGKTGNILTYLAEELQSFSKALDILGDAVPYELKQQYKGSENENRISKVILPEGSTKAGRWHRLYLQERGFKVSDLEDLYNVLYCGPLGKWSNRIIVPVLKGYRTVTFTSIDISEESYLRYKHLSDKESILPIKKHLLGLEHTNGHTAMVVEGFFDHLRIGKGSVCTFGTKVTSEQKRLLANFKRLILVGDGDDAGHKMNDDLGHDMAAFCEVTIIGLPNGKDPDKLPKKDIKELKQMLGTY